MPVARRGQSKAVPNLALTRSPTIIARIAMKQSVIGKRSQNSVSLLGFQ
jgi:hypothetical protein